MKSKKLSHNKTSYDKLNNVWLPPLPTNKRTGWLPPQNIFQDSKTFSDNIPDTFIAVDPQL